MSSLRKWGIGGLFSYLGYFSNRILGSYKTYATHRKYTMIITTTDNEKIVVYPSNPKDFVQALQNTAT